MIGRFSALGDDCAVVFSAGLAGAEDVLTTEVSSVISRGGFTKRSFAEGVSVDEVFGTFFSRIGLLLFMPIFSTAHNPG